MSRPVQGALRDVFRVSRYARDLVGEIGLGHLRLGEGEEAAAAFGGQAAFTDINPRFAGERFELKPGDVILQRGMAHNSAAIARIGDVDLQFSHVAIVARDDDGSPVIVEALIEDGAVVTPLEEALAHAVGRAIVFRHHDDYLAERASELIRDHVKAANAREDIRYPLRFHDGVGQSTRTCSARTSCDWLSRWHQRPMCSCRPMRPCWTCETAISCNASAVTARQTFAPGDLELEPDFDVVAEWRDYRITSELRLKDMIMTKLFEWMELHDYNFRPTLLDPNSGISRSTFDQAAIDGCRSGAARVSVRFRPTCQPGPSGQSRCCI